MDIIIVLATSDDLTTVADVTIKAWQATFSGILPAAFLEGLQVETQLNRHRKLFSSPGVLYYVALKEGRVIGFASAGPCRAVEFTEPNELYGLYMLPEWQRQGLGRRLFRAAAQGVQKQRSGGLLALVLSDNPCRSSYVQCGGAMKAASPIELGGQAWPDGVRI
jgi:GNAT superfamily N-acetyltransferase